MKEIWFKRRRFGWGWEPVTWQGWLVVVAYIAADVAFALTIDERSTVTEVLFTFILPITLLTISLIRFCYAYGEKPRWQWGKDLGDPDR
jgi:hypothetical protein